MARALKQVKAQLWEQCCALGVELSAPELAALFLYRGPHKFSAICQEFKVLPVSSAGVVRAFATQLSMRKTLTTRHQQVWYMAVLFMQVCVVM